MSMFSYLKSYDDHKLEPWSFGCVFLSYSMNYKGYVCLVPFTVKTIVSRHVIFNESCFPFSKLSSTCSPNVSSESSYIAVLGVYQLPLLNRIVCLENHSIIKILINLLLLNLILLLFCLLICLSHLIL